MIPCKDCIAFAICNAKEDKLSCSLLYEYFIEGGISVAGADTLQLKRLNDLSTFFNRKASRWYFTSSGMFSNDQYITIHWIKFPRKLRSDKF